MLKMKMRRVSHYAFSENDIGRVWHISFSYFWVEIFHRFADFIKVFIVTQVRVHAIQHLTSLSVSFGSKVASILMRFRMKTHAIR